ncbi:MAG: hypothetical protein IJ435_02570 [Clostridia bacterium]|nr:hypothetical protein [Clostridia bacterium]
MFRELYKEANDSIKGDRIVLDRAFLKAAQPAKKKSPVIKYSFIGTAALAVIVLGAVFLNPSVFTNRTETIGKPVDETPTEKETVVNTLLAPEVDFVDETPEDEVVVEAVAEKTVDAKVEKKVPTKKAPGQKSGSVQASNETGGDTGGDGEGEPDGAGDEAAVADEYAVMTLGLDGEDEGVYEGETEAFVGFTLRRPGGDAEEEATEEVTEEATEEITEELTEEVTEEMTEEETAKETTEAEVGVFSYMYDKSVYEAGEWGVVTEGFANTDISPIMNSADAIERAKNECTVEYTRTTVFRDNIEDMWLVNFGTDALGGDQSVYMNSDGITQLIVYGE